jgi:hypothetical protein
LKGLFDPSNVILWDWNYTDLILAFGEAALPSTGIRRSFVKLLGSFVMFP